MEPGSLHPVSSEMVADFLASLPNGVEVDLTTDSSQQALTRGLGSWLAGRQPVFAADGLSLTGWEARIDRGISMMLRPPSRLFAEAGMAPERVRRLPIRVDLYGAVMGGCYIPAHLIPHVEERLDQKLAVTVRRMIEAELDPVRLQSVMMAAARYARENGLGLYEVSGLIDSQDPHSWPPGGVVVSQPVDPEVLERIDAVLRPPKPPGRVKRLLGRLNPPNGKPGQD